MLCASADFEWQVIEAGYRIVRVGELNQNALDLDQLVVASVEDPLGHDLPVRVYQPLQDYPGLFRVLAQTDPTQSGVVEFANRFGLLNCRHSSEQPSFPLRPGAKLDMFLETSDSFVAWTKEIKLLRKAVALWDAVLEGSNEELAKLVTHKGRLLSYKPTGSRVTPHLQLVDSESELAAKGFWHTGIRRSALRVLQALISQRLSKFECCFRVEVTPDIGTKSFQLTITPSDLLSAIWLQFAESIDERKRYRQCEQCKIWFKMDLRAQRHARAFCSNACRVHAYRLRVAKAQELASQGVSTQRIAEQLQSDVKTVQDWIARKCK